MDESVRRITVIHSGPEGRTPEVVYAKEDKSGKGSRLLRPAQKLQHRVLKAQKALADEALALHERHARKRKDGWLRDAPVIAFKANRKAFKKLTGL